MNRTVFALSIAACFLATSANAEGARIQAKPTPKAAGTKPAPKSAGGKPAVKRTTTAPAKAAPKPIVIPASGDLQQHDLLAIARMRIGDMSTDAFTGEITSQYSGRYFVIRQAVTQGLNGDWEYSVDEKTLKLRTIDLNEISIMFKRTPKGSFIGQTAMGVKFKIDKYSELSVVARIANSYDFPDLVYEAPLPPIEAKKLVASSVVVLEGYLEASSGTLTTCGDEELNASLDDPRLIFRFECSIRAKLTRLSFEDGYGNVLKARPEN